MPAAPAMSITGSPAAPASPPLVVVEPAVPVLPLAPAPLPLAPLAPLAPLVPTPPLLLPHPGVKQAVKTKVAAKYPELILGIAEAPVGVGKETLIDKK
jgi:hypothetical protein